MVNMFLILLSSLTAFFITFILIKNIGRIKDYIRWRILIEKLPTSDGKRFLIGHAGVFLGVPIEQTWKMIREWHETPSPPLYTFYLGPTLIFVAIIGAEEIEAAISTMRNTQKAEPYEFLGNWLEDGLLLSKGEKWQARRKILTPAFHFSILREFMDIFTRETSKMVQEIEEGHLDKPVDITQLISTFTLLTINETSMGTKLDVESVDGLAYKNAVYQMGDLIYRRIIEPWSHYNAIFYRTAAGKREKKLVNVLHDFTNNIIRKRSENFKVFENPVNEDGYIYSNKKKYPLLDILLNAKLKDNSIDEKGIREEVNTFMFEGHDTTAMSLMYTMMLLACNRSIQDEVYQEIVHVLGFDSNKDADYADLQNMTLLERCIKESLRLYPSVPLIGRKMNSDVHTKYGIIPSGTTIFMHIYDLHRNPKYWSDPEKFDPSRHLPENSRKRHPLAYIPFSAGPRNCIGQRFAMLELKTAICGILRKFILEPVDTPESLVLTQDMVLRPKNGVKVKFVLRR